MVAYTKPQRGKKEESKMLRAERNQIKFIDLKFERWQIVVLNELCWGMAMVKWILCCVFPLPSSAVVSFS